MPVRIIHHVNVVLIHEITGKFLKTSVLELIVLYWLLIWIYNIFLSAIHPISSLSYALSSFTGHQKGG